MNCRKDYAFLICLAGLGVAIVGYLLSVLSTFITRFTSRLLGHPKPTSTTRSSPHLNPSTPTSSVSTSAAKPDSDSVPEKTTLQSTPSKHRERREKLHIDVRDNTPERDSKSGKLSESLMFGKLARGVSPTRHVIHFRNPTSGIPIIAVSPPPPPRLSTQSDSSVSTDSQISSSEGATSCSDTAAAAPAVPEEQPRGRRSRFAKLVHIFSDKRSSKPRRRDSLPALRSRMGHAARASESSAIPPVPPLPPNVSVPSTPPQTIAMPPPTSDVAAAPALVPPSPPHILRSKPVNQKAPRRRRSLIVRAASCPSLWYHGRCHSESSAGTAVPPVPPIPQSPVLPQSPTRSWTREQSPGPIASPPASPPAKKPKPRTHPYEAPYFIPPPDSVNVEKPLTIRKRPSRRQTSPTQLPGHEHTASGSRAASLARARESIAVHH